MQPRILFSKPDYALQLYRALFPNDSSISQSEIDIITLQNSLGYQIHNDLGLLVRNTLIVLLEAQTKWTMNIIFRLVGYYYNTVVAYLRRTMISLDDTVRAPLPRVKAFVVYTGEGTVKATDLSLRHAFYNDEEDQPDFRAKVIQLKGSQGILNEFISFCNTFDQQRKLHKDDQIKAIQETIRICKSDGYLVDYLKGHEEEVERLMRTQLVTHYTPLEMDQRAHTLKTVACSWVDGGHSDQEIKDYLKKKYNVDNEQYAQNIVDYVKENPNPEDWY